MERIWILLRRAGAFILKKILLFVAGIAVLTAASFLITRNFSVNAYSDRLVWVGLFLFILAVVVWVGVFFAGVQYGVPTLIRKPEEAKRLITNRQKIQEVVERRYMAAIQIWVIGLLCIVLGAAVQILWGRP